MEIVYKRTANGGYEVTQNIHNFLSFSPDGTPEMAPSNKFVIRIIIFLVNLQFIFQGSQKIMGQGCHISEGARTIILKLASFDALGPKSMET